MAYRWGIYKSGVFYDFMSPVRQIRISDEYDEDRKKSVMVEGEQISGCSRNAVTITLSGSNQISTDGTTDTKVCTFQTQFSAYTQFRAACHTTNADKYELFIIYDAASSYYRKFKRVSCKSFSCDMGDDNRIELPYNVVFTAEDPTIYTTAPGA